MLLSDNTATDPSFLRRWGDSFQVLGSRSLGIRGLGPVHRFSDIRKLLRPALALARLRHDVGVVPPDVNSVLGISGPLRSRQTKWSAKFPVSTRQS